MYQVKYFVLLFLLSFLPFPTHAAVVINEIFPKSADMKLTWVELYNTGPNTVSLDRWRLENSTQGSYILEANASIASNGFLTFYQTQSGISFNIEGDSVQFFDDKNNLVDSQSYPGILGYNTSMGRNTDGGVSWVICTTATPNTSNKCPPAPTNTPTATYTPTKSPTPLPSFIPITPTTTIDSSSKFAFPDVLGVTNLTPTPTPILETVDTYKKVWVICLVAGVGLGIIIMSIGLYKTFKSDRIDSDA